MADSVGAKRTPEVVVLDAGRVIRYRGRIDDQYGFQAIQNYQKTAPTDRDLVKALDAVLAGNPVATSETQPAGCLIGRDLKPVADSDVTYTRQVARIMNANCVFCHREGQIAPFALTSYEEVAGWASMIEEVVETQRMPPWHADPHYGHFLNDARLSDKDKATISKWVANGAPEGDLKDLPEPPKFADRLDDSQARPGDLHGATSRSTCRPPAWSTTRCSSSIRAGKRTSGSAASNRVPAIPRSCTTSCSS